LPQPAEIIFCVGGGRWRGADHGDAVDDPYLVTRSGIHVVIEQLPAHPSGDRRPEMTELRIAPLTVVPTAGQVLRDAEIAVSADSGRITYLGPFRGPLGPGDLGGTGRLAIPGLVNAHTHSAMTLLRGYSDDVPLRSWLTHVRAFELRLTAADIQAGLRLALAEMLRSGTVAFIDMFHWTSALLGTVSEAGMRVSAAPAVFGYDSVAFPMADPTPGSGILDGTAVLAAEFAGDPLVGLAYGLHAPYTCPPEMISEVAVRSRAEGIGVHIHLSESAREVDESVRLFGVTPIRQVADLGLLDGRVHIAHAVHPRDGDFELLSRAGVTVSHNPVSNLKLGSGIAPVHRYLSAGVRLGLGTDSVASNNTLDMFEEIKMGVLAQRGLALDPSVISGADLFRMATAGGAPAVDGALSGVLAVGEPADLVLLDVTGTTALPFTDPGSFVVYAARGTDVTDVFVAGRRLVANRTVTTIDEEAARADVAERAARILAELAAG
jgi:5-methylthioadenosine/S-adenosylhomocysteine deaminase